MGMGLLGEEGWSLLGRLKRAVKKIRFLLNFDLNRWKVSSMMIDNGSSRRRVLSFNDRDIGADGLRGLEDSNINNNDSSSTSRAVLRRSCSEDIDKKADLFIANFYKQLRLERQISLQLRYANNNNNNNNYNYFASPSP